MLALVSLSLSEPSTLTKVGIVIAGLTNRVLGTVELQLSGIGLLEVAQKYGQNVGILGSEYAVNIVLSLVQNLNFLIRGWSL